jgi:hypothetical protein
VGRIVGGDFAVLLGLLRPIYSFCIDFVYVVYFLVVVDLLLRCKIYTITFIDHRSKTRSCLV